MEHYIRSTTYEVPFDAVLSEPGVNWFSDAVPTNLDTGPRAVIGTHGEDEILAACHRDKPSIGLLFPRCSAQMQAGKECRSADPGRYCNAAPSLPQKESLAIT